MFGIWCTVSGGITGSRSAWLKGADSQTKYFDTLENAQAEAKRLSDKTNGSPYRTASFSYRAMEYDF